MKFQEALIPARTKDMFLLKLYHSQVKPGKRQNRRHHHTEFEIALFKSGSGTYTVGDTAYAIQPGDIFLFSTHEVHCITEIHEGEDMLLLNVHFEPRFIWSTGNDLFDAKYLKIFFERNDAFENRLDRQNPATAVIRSLILQMEDEFAKQLLEYELMVKIQLLTILVTVSRHYDYVSRESSRPAVHVKSLSQIEDAIHYIHDHLDSDLSLDDLAKAANMSRSYFSTIFKRLNGISPWDYITIKRIEQSIEYLESTDSSILEIACRCGFNNTANFNRAFKKITGKTPSEYR